MKRHLPDPTAPEPFAALEREALELLWQHDPVQASVVGVEQYDALLPRTDPAARAEFCWRTSDLLSRLERLPPPAGSDPAARSERWALASLLRVPRVMEEEFSPFTRNPVLYIESLLQGVYILFQRPGPLEERRAHTLCARLREAPRLLEEGRRNLQPHAARVPPCWVDSALRQVEGGQVLIRQALQSLEREVPAMARDAGRTAGMALEHLSRYADFLRQEIQPRARGTFAIGRDLFHFLLREEHHLAYRDVDLEEWARHEIHEARKELERVAVSIDPARDWRAILEDLKGDHPPESELVEAYRSEVERARSFVIERGVATVPPEDELVVAETPEFERWTVPYAAYLPPPVFGRWRRGYLWVTPPAGHLGAEQREEILRDHCRSRIPITSLHETYPGHHLQFTRLCHLRSAVRRQFATSVYVEGWALYCEEMMLEQGFVSDPRARLFQLRDHLWRACRVLLDVGLHAGSVGTQEAARLLVEEACLQPPNAAAEVARYTQTPTQPLSYLVGKREIQSLRRELERTMGPRFRLSAFHDQLLSHGSIPICFLREILLAALAEPAPAPATA